MRLVQGNEAVVLGALAAGCNFYAGYPITPATEIMEQMARMLPGRGGVFIQMEDELAALGAVIGATWGGMRAMTATSGPGFSLMQEHIGYAAMTQTPCVVVDSQRIGPSTGQPTMPAQGDVMQARWGSHGDRPAIVVTASSVKDVYDMTQQSFTWAFTYRLPVVLLLDAVLSHMRENIELPAVSPPSLPTSADSADSEDPYKPFGNHPFVPFSANTRTIVSGLAHDETGNTRGAVGPASEQILRDSLSHLDEDYQKITRHRNYRLEDAQWLIISYGITARAARAAVDILRESGVRAGLLELMTLWPFPELIVKSIARHVQGILLPELNLGQLVLPLRAAVGGLCPVAGLGRADGELFTPEAIAQAMISHSRKIERRVSHHA
ncbi:MAG: 2-oxoacid:acceptor oxidoreductase subunit alpha [Firmicutes bacterium]|jgi:2-oxoglutarate ferredoxin oxidoreductase subunit alpha|nr:2-oxoacid:acceptor oxidoreductase subunit alpha [Bacillota bacterium]